MSRDELITDNMKLVYYVIHRNFPMFAKNEDVFQEGCIGLIKAADNYEEGKGEFRNYAYTSILNAIRTYLRANKQDTEVLSLDYTMNIDDDESVALIDIISDDSFDKWFDKVERDIFLQSLSKREQRIVQLLKEGKNQTEIGEEFGVTRQMISRYVTKIQSKWRWYIEEN